MNPILKIDAHISKLVDFVLKNRHKGAFPDYSGDELYVLFKQNMFQRTMLFTENEKTGMITGVVHGAPDFDGRSFYVYNILTTERTALVNFLRFFDNMFPGFSLKARRHGKIIIYNLPQFRRKLLKEID